MFITEEYVQNFECTRIFVIFVSSAVSPALNNMILILIELFKLRMECINLLLGNFTSFDYCLKHEFSIGHPVIHATNVH